LLLNLSKIALLVTLLFLTGCSNRFTNFTQKSYHSSSYAYEQNKKLNYADTQPKIRNSKAMHRATMRPYIVMGKKYYPTLAHVGDELYGIASWYGPDFHAKKTSNGEIYNMYAMTAAHKTLPMNTMVRVKNLDNGLSVVVRINDRGPFVSGRIIDLSNVAAHKIDMVKKGTANVKLTVLGFNAKIATSPQEKQETASSGNYFLQVGVYSVVSSAHTVKRKFEMILDNNKYKVILKDDEINNKKVKRVWISGFRSEQETHDFKVENQLEKAMIIAQ
jgi:rare lipoprotein A